MRPHSLIFFAAMLLPNFAWGHSPAQREPIVYMVLQEAANEPFNGMVAIAGVAFDRMVDRRWPSAAEAVVHQPAQFTGVHIELRKYSQRQIEQARLAVAIALSGFRPCGGVFWYHTVDVKPIWRLKLVEQCRVGAHVFYGDGS